MEEVTMAKRANGEGTIYKDSASGRWVGAIAVDGRRRKVKARTRDEVRKRLDELKRTTYDGGVVVDGNMTVRQLVALYEAKALTTRGRRSNTVDSHRWALVTMTKHLGAKRVRKLTVDDVEDALAATGLSHASLVKVRSVLAQAFDFGQRRQLVAHNVVRLAELPTDARRSDDGRAFTVEQAQTFMTVAHGDRLEALWFVMLGLGLRPGEATALSWADVDMRQRRLHVRCSLKRERGAFVLDERLKTSRSRRTLDMPPFVVEALQAHRGRQRVERLAAALWPSEWVDLVFVTVHGTPIDASNLRRAFRNLTAEAGLGQWHPHELRHSAASILSDAGVPLEHIGDVLGHDGTRMTARVYRHAIGPSVTAAAEPMQKVLGVRR